MKAEHYLITIDLCPAPAHLHCYLITKDRSCFEAVYDRMFEVAQNHGITVRLPMILQTTLSTGKEIVREIVTNIGPKKLKPRQDFYCSIFLCLADSADDKRLMELH